MLANETKSTIFFNPPYSTYNPIVISPNARENIFNIQNSAGTDGVLTIA